MEDLSKKTTFEHYMFLIDFVSHMPNSKVSEMVIGRCVSALKDCKTREEAHQIIDWIFGLPETEVNSTTKALITAQYFKFFRK